MTADEYVRDRLDHQIAWYDAKSRRNHAWFRGLRITELVLAAAIPFFASYASDARPHLKIAAGLSGVVVAILSGLIALEKFQENWIQYRATCEGLRHHKFRFLANAPPYDGPGAFPSLVSNVEALISSETTNWAQHLRSASGQRASG